MHETELETGEVDRCYWLCLGKKDIYILIKINIQIRTCS